MKFLSVCSGIEAATVAWGPLGWEAIGFSEIEPFPSAVLKHHYPDVPNHGDMTRLPQLIATGAVDAPDLLCGGTPCQAFSVAGLRQSLDDDRGNLTLVFCEIADAIDAARARAGQQPCVVFWENVPGVLSTKDNAFGCFLAALAGEDLPLVAPGGRWSNAGHVSGPQRAVSWRVLDAQYFGLAQRRRRVFVVASAREGFDPAAVLFEREGVRRDTAPSREAGQRVTGSLVSRAARNCGQANDDVNGHKIITMASGQGKAEIGFDFVPTATCNRDAPIAAYTPDVSAMLPARSVTHSLRADGFDASEDGTGRETPIIPVAHVGTMPTTTAGGPSASSHNQTRGQMRDQYVVPVRRGSHWDSFENPHPTLNQSAKSSGGIAASDQEIFSQRGSGLVPVAYDSHGVPATSGASETDVHTPLRARAPGGSEASTTTAVLQPIAFNARQDPDAWVDRTGPIDTDGCTQAVAIQDVRAVNKAQNGRGWNADGSAYTVDTHATQGVVAFAQNTRDEVREMPYVGALAADPGMKQTSYIRTAMQVRRLTPVECERLQGFPDGYTAIPWRTYQEAQRKGVSYESLLLERGLTLRGPSVDDCPDGPRYKALGNSWAVPVVRWIGRRIARELSK